MEDGSENVECMNFVYCFENKEYALDRVIPQHAIYVWDAVNLTR